MEFRCRIMWKLMVQAFLVWKNRMESMNVAELTRRLADIAFEKPSHELVSDPNLVQSLPGYKIVSFRRTYNVLISFC